MSNVFFLPPNALVPVFIDYMVNNMKEEEIISIQKQGLGYKNKTISIPEIKSLNYLISLEESINELNTVYVSNKKPNADSIIARARQNISKNYDTKLYKHEVFSRETTYMDFDKLDFEIEKTSRVKKKNLESANNALNALSKKIRESDIIEFTDFKGTLYSFDKDSSKLVVNKATKLLDYKNDFSMEDIQEKSQKIVL